MLHSYCSSETAEWIWVKLESTLNELWQPQGIYYEDCCYMVQHCHHIWYVTNYTVSPYMVCDSLYGVTIYGMWQSTWRHHIWFVTLHGFTICGMWQSTWCHHIWYVTVYMVSPYMACDSLHGVTIYGLWQTTWFHHMRYVTVYMVSPYMVCDSLHGVTIYGMWQTTCCHNTTAIVIVDCFCFPTLLEILSLRPFIYIHFSFCIFTSRRYEGHLENKERFAIKKYLLIIGKKKNMQVLWHTFTYFST